MYISIMGGVCVWEEGIRNYDTQQVGNQPVDSSGASSSDGRQQAPMSMTCGKISAAQAAQSIIKQARAAHSIIRKANAATTMIRNARAYR